MAQSVELTGMVLSAMPLGEYDKRITILTKESGKITAFARGARRPNGKLIAATNPFVFGTFELVEGRNAYTLIRASVHNYFRELAADVDAAYMGFYFLEFASYFCQEGNDERQMLKLLYQSLRALESPVFSPRLVRAVFELKAMGINGIGPEVLCCVHCRGALKSESETNQSEHMAGQPEDRISRSQSEAVRMEGKANQPDRTKGRLEDFTGRLDVAKVRTAIFSSRRGGMLCADCAAGEKGLVLQESTLYTMQFVLSTPVEKLYTFQLTEPVLAEFEAVMREYMRCHVSHEFKSLKVLESLESLAIP